MSTTIEVKEDPRQVHYVLYERLVDLVPYYAMYAEQMRDSLETIKETARSIQDWRKVVLKRSVNQEVTCHDPYAVRVEVEGKLLAHVNNLDSPMIAMMLDFAQEGLVVLDCVVSYQDYVDDEGLEKFGLYLMIQVRTRAVELKELLESAYAEGLTSVDPKSFREVLV